jgi:hypothetical protein
MAGASGSERALQLIETAHQSTDRGVHAGRAHAGRRELVGAGLHVPLEVAVGQRLCVCD